MRRRIPIGIVTFRPDLAEGDGALRHRATGDQQPAILRRPGIGTWASLAVVGNPPKTLSTSAASSSRVISPTAPMTSPGRRSRWATKPIRSSRVIAATLCTVPVTFPRRGDPRKRRASTVDRKARAGCAPAARARRRISPRTRSTAAGSNAATSTQRATDPPPRTRLLFKLRRLPPICLDRPQTSDR